MSHIDPERFRELGFNLMDPITPFRPTHDQVAAVDCPHCHAKAEQACTLSGIIKTNYVLAHHHRDRIIVATHKYKPLSNPDKAIMVQYGFLILCNAVAAKSLEILGKEMTTVDVQYAFINKALQELREIGIL